MDDVELSDVPVRVPSVLGREVDGELVLVHPGQGKVRVLNAAGGRLWELMDGARTVADLAQTIASEYAVDIARARADALVFCTDLRARGLLVLSR